MSQSIRSTTIALLIMSILASAVQTMPGPRFEDPNSFPPGPFDCSREGTAADGDDGFTVSVTVSEVASEVCADGVAIQICVTVTGVPGLTSCAKKTLTQCHSSSSTLNLDCGDVAWQISPGGSSATWGNAYASQSCNDVNIDP